MQFRFKLKKYFFREFTLKFIFLKKKIFILIFLTFSHPLKDGGKDMDPASPDLKEINFTEEEELMMGIQLMVL
jgi:hypothetical protein